MSRLLNLLVLIALMLLVLLSPLPLGSNREWSWTLCALLAGLLGAAWVVVNLRPAEAARTGLSPFIPLFFTLACAWVIFQASGLAPVSWQHPLWTMTGEVLGKEIPGRISLSADDSMTALMRLLSYAAVFTLALILGRDRKWAQAIFGWLTIGGLVYGVFGLLVYWGGYHPQWLFGEQLLAHDVRSTFINRNHFATWQGLTMLCAMAYFYHRMAKPEVKPYSVPKDRETQVEEFILKAWKPMIALLLMVTALVLTHSRGGFVSALAGTLVLLWLLDRRAVSRNRSKRKTLSRITVGTALLVASIAFFLTSEMLLDRINRTDISTEERMAVFGNINRAIGDNPVLGFGYGTFADSFRLYDLNEATVHYDRAHNTWLENAFELGVPAALLLFATLAGLALTCLLGVRRRHRDWVYPATGVAASVLVGTHALVDFSLQLPAVAMLFALVMGVACAQSFPTAAAGKDGGFR